jgi:predicted phosphodiesterase
MRFFQIPDPGTSRFAGRARVLLILICVFSGAAFAHRTRTVRFGMVTDIHYADRDAAGTRYYREARQKLAEFVSVMNQQKPDFVVEMGDYKDQDAQPDPARTLTYARSMESVLAGFRGRRYHVLGNHDEDSLAKSDFLSQVVNSGINRARSFYSFDAGGIHFIALDANFRSDGKDYEKGNYDWTDANVPAHELAWLQKDLASTKRRTIVLIHQQLDGVGSYYVKNAPAVRKILEESGRVLAVFQGHRHEGAYSLMQGIHYYTLKGLIEGSGPANNAYALVEVDSDSTIHIQGFRTEASSELKRAGGFLTIGIAREEK